MSQSDAASRVHRDTVELAARLIACRSLTPSDGGALDVIASRLRAVGFACERLDRGSVGNLWAQRGEGRPRVCLAGHVDVVPPGPLDRWTADPFTPTERHGALYGRGAADMKTSIAAMVTAAERVATSNQSQAGSMAFLLTSDEEGDAIDGTAAAVAALRARGTSVDCCILGEPTSVERLGDTIKNGRRGSVNAVLRVEGVQCHIAYPERGANPIHLAVPALNELVSTEWDTGNEYFPPTGFQISNVRAGAGATNIIPGTLEVLFNFRFSPECTSSGLESRVRSVLDRHRLQYELHWGRPAEPFLTPRGPLSETLRAAVKEIAGVTPELSTGGGTSDGRFLTNLAREVIEFGPVNESIHKVDEHVALADIAPLSMIYERAVTTLLRDTRTSADPQPRRS